MRSSDFQVEQRRTVLMVVGWFVVVLIGIGMLWLGFSLGKGRQPAEGQASPTATSVVPGVVQPPAGAVIPTYTPLPTDTPLAPTAIPTETPVPEPMIVAQAGGVNLRSGPDTNFSSVGRIEGGASLRVTGKYADWWQVDYAGTPAWVANWVVTASNTEGVPDVVPPPSPIPPTRVPPTSTPGPPTAIPATATPDTRGIVSNAFIVGNKQEDDDINPNDRFGNAGDVWFYMSITNTSGDGRDIVKWGVWVQETGDYQRSWGGPGGGEPLRLETGQSKEWDDHINQFTLGKGTYHLWMRVCFNDGYCVNIDGPVEIRIG
jgi:hypothetical protein